MKYAKMKILDRLRTMNNAKLFNFLSSLAIIATETYPYEIEIGNIEENKPSKVSPEGKIEIGVPDPIWRNLDTFINDPAMEGMVSLKAHNRTNLNQLIDLRKGNERFPLIDILKTAKEYPDLFADDFMYNLTRKPGFKYEPDKLGPSPLAVKVAVYDEQAIAEFWEKRSLEQSEAAFTKIAKMIVKNIYEQSGFESSLILDIRLTFKLPKTFERLPKDKILLDKFALKWPLSTSPRQVALFIYKDFGGKLKKILTPKNVVYNPEDGKISWSNLPFFEMEPKDEEQNFVEYQAPLMQLLIREPGVFYETAVLNGSAKISLSGLFSGLELTKSKKAKLLIKENISLFNRLFPPKENGIRERIIVRFPSLRPLLDPSFIRWIGLVSSKSEIKADIKIHLDELFANRTVSPYQMLHFPDLILNDRRIADILHLLSDLRFQVGPNPYNDFEPALNVSRNGDSKSLSKFPLKKKRHVLWAEREEGAGSLTLWIVLEGEHSTTTREKLIVGDHKLTTGYDSGCTTIYIRGQLKGDTDRVVEVISDIHSKLKVRFRHVNTVK